MVEQYKIDRLKILEENLCQRRGPRRDAVEEYLDTTHPLQLGSDPRSTRSLWSS